MKRKDRIYQWSMGIAKLFLLIIGIIGLLVYLGWVLFASKLPLLQLWHSQAPAAEFMASDETSNYDFDDYLKQEDRVFSELDHLSKGPWANAADVKFCRFNATSLCNPERLFPQNWNRTFIRKVEKPKGGILFLHGLSDSPYSFRVLSERLMNEGYTSIVMRVPGHGTCPAALAKTRNEDWRAAVRVGVKGLRSMLPADAPWLVVGFSNGGALAVDYAISALKDPSLPRPNALVLLSPMIGITDLANIATFHREIAWLSGDPRANWSVVSPEIDPFKYTSWPMNGSVQGWRMTQRVESGLADLAAAGRMTEFPPVLTFQSAIDATVEVPKLIQSLYNRVAKNSSELVVFDVNRMSWLNPLINDRFEKALEPIFLSNNLAYKLSRVTNVADDRSEVCRVIRDGAELHREPLAMNWPRDLYSLSHYALPFSEEDPVYGRKLPSRQLLLELGDLNLRGESGGLLISDGMLLRLRYNPFYPFIESHALDWMRRVLPIPIH